MWRVTFSALAVWILSGALWADVTPRGVEFRVNTYATDIQISPSVASDAAGNFVVVWRSDGQDGSASGIFGRRFDSTGAPLGLEFQVNTHTTSYQDSPSVGSGAAGSFVVIWQSLYQDGSLSGLFGRAFDSTGLPAGPEFQVNTYSSGYQEGPSVASDAAGNIVTAWRSLGQDGSGWGGFGRRFDSSGLPLSAEVAVNTYTTGSQAPSSVASDSAGNFVVVWTSFDQDGSASGVFGRRFDSSGVPLGSEFQINTWTTSYQESPRVASDDDGDFVVVWQSWEQDGFYWGVVGRRFDSTGAPSGAEFAVNVFSTHHQLAPSVASAGDGSFVVVWTSYYQDDSSCGVFGRRFDSTGAPAGTEFQVNTWTTSTQNRPSIASDAAGDFAVAWTSYDQDGSSWGIFGQRFFGRIPTFINPLPGDTVDCSNPRVIRPTLAWNDDGYDRFRVHIGWDPGFGAGRQVTSGDSLLRDTFWTPPAKKWRKACANALAVNPGSPKLYVKLFSVSGSLPKQDPGRKRYSTVVPVIVQP